MSNTPDGPAGSVQSVDRAITALELLARVGQAGVSEVAGVVGVHKSTASRLLAALQARGLVELAGERGRYRLGYGILRLAAAMGDRLDITTQGREVCDELAAELGETVNIAVRQGEQAVNVYQAHGGAAVSVNNWVGRPTPLHATSSGKVLLAFSSAPQNAQRSAARAALEEFTERTVTDPQVLLDQLNAARSNGYAVTAGEYEVGLNAVAAPIFGAAPGVLAALSLSGPAFRLSEGDLPSVGRRVVAAAIRISERMGHYGGVSTR